MVNFDGTTHLLEYINLASEDTIYHTLVCSLLQHQNLIAESTITEIADLCFVSAATLSRFCKKLEYKDYAHFKESFTINYEFERDYTATFLRQMSEEPENSIYSLSSQIQVALDDCAHKIDFEVLDKILGNIHESNNVAFFSSHILLQMATDIQQRLQKLGKLTYAFTRLSYQNEHIKKMDENSLAIFISVNGGQ